MTMMTAAYTVLPKAPGYQCFFTGNVFILIERIVGYGFLQFKHMAILHIVCIVTRFSLYGIIEPAIPIIAFTLEIMTVVLSFKSERGQRKLYHEMYKARADALKFKHLLTELLPNQMLIFESRSSRAEIYEQGFQVCFPL